MALAARLGLGRGLDSRLDNLTVRMWRLPRRLDFWFGPKRFESEHLYEGLGALLLKRYVPTGGDLVMQRLRRNHPERRWVTSSLQSLRVYERRTRLNEFIHLAGFTCFTVLIVSRFASGSLTVAGLVIAGALNVTLGLWPVTLQRYNRLRLYRAIAACSRRRAARGKSESVFEEKRHVRIDR